MPWNGEHLWDRKGSLFAERRSGAQERGSSDPLNRAVAAPQIQVLRNSSGSENASMTTSLAPTRRQAPNHWQTWHFVGEFSAFNVGGNPTLEYKNQPRADGMIIRSFQVDKRKWK
ncbi:hypothetical protein VTK26DRAFT_6707 [Humicola hyalothermophila]